MPSLVRTVLTLLLVSALFPYCRKSDIGTDPLPADRANRLFLFQQRLIPLVRAIYFSEKRTGSEGGVPLCGDLELLEGDTAHFPEGNSLRYRYDRGNGCLEEWGNEGSGALQVTFTGAFEEEGSSVLLEGEGFEAHSVRLEGAFRIHWAGERQRRAEWNGTAFRVDGKEVSTIGSMKSEMLRGSSGDSSITDDRYAFALELKGEGLGGASYRMETREAVERDMSCRNPWKGMMELKARDLGLRELYYGDGSHCSDSVELLVNGKKSFLLIE